MGMGQGLAVGVTHIVEALASYEKTLKSGLTTRGVGPAPLGRRIAPTALCIYACLSASTAVAML